MDINTPSYIFHQRIVVVSDDAKMKMNDNKQKPTNN